MYFKDTSLNAYTAAEFSGRGVLLTYGRFHGFLFLINLFLMVMVLVLLICAVSHCSVALADDVINGGGITSNSGFICNPSRVILPKTQYQRELIQHFYRSAPLDVEGYYMEIYRIFTTNERFFIYGYLTFCDVVISPEPWTEASIHKECLNLNIQYMVRIVLAAKEYFPEFSSEGSPPENYLNSKLGHPWLQHGPNFFGVIPFDQLPIIPEPSIEDVAQNILVQQQTTRITTIRYQDCRTLYEKAVFNRYKDNTLLLDQLFHIYNSNERYLLYGYVSYCDLAMHSKPGDELMIQKACLDFADPQFIVDVVQTGKNYIIGFNESGRPPLHYLTEKIGHPWLGHVQNFTGITPAEMSMRYNPRNQNERDFLVKFFLHGDKATFEHLYHIFSSNEKYLVYQYILFYDPVLMPRKEGTEEDLFRICLNLDPQFMIDIVTAAKSHWYDFNSDWRPDPDYLEFRQGEPGMEFGPRLFLNRGYVFAAVLFISGLAGIYVIGDSGINGDDF